MATVTTNLVADKVTKNTVRFLGTMKISDGSRLPLSIYLPKEVVEDLGFESEVGTTIAFAFERA